MKSVEKAFRNHYRKIGAVALSVGLSVSTAAGFTLLDDGSDIPVFDNADAGDSQDVSSQIDQRQQKIEAVSGTGEENMDYTRLSC